MIGAQQQQPSQPGKTLGQHLNDLEFVTAAFTWLFRLMSRAAEPLMTLAAIYVIIEAGVPAISVPWLHMTAIALMISAPEIILPGGFILAGELKAQSNPRYRYLYGMCWVFVALTIATLADLFIWHFRGSPLAALMWARCAAAVGYSIIFRVITYKRERELIAVADVWEMVTEQFAEFSAGLQSAEANIAHLTETTTELFGNRFAEALQQISLQITEHLDQTLGKHLAALDLETIQAMPEQITALAQDTQGKLQAISKEMITAFNAQRTLRAEGIRPNLKVVEPNSPNSVPKGGETNTETNFDKKAFVRSCLAGEPNIRSTEIQRRATELGITISPGYISDVRKAYFAEQGGQPEEETA